MNIDPSRSVNPDGCPPPHLFDKYSASTGYTLGGTVRDSDTDGTRLQVTPSVSWTD